MTSGAARPNLFLIGAPKSGTTTLHHWLDRHPDVFMSRNKEPRFFCNFPRDAAYTPNKDGFVYNLVTDQADYSALFVEARSEKWIGESSTDYLWADKAPLNIFSATRELESVKIIAVLRNPVDRAFSEHSALIRDGLEDLSFLESFDVEEKRYTENWLPLFYHLKRGLYATPLANYIDTFGKESVGVFLFDDLVASPTEFIEEVCKFLDISPVNESMDATFNRSGRPRSRFVQAIERNNGPVKSAFQALTTRGFRTRLKLGIQKLNLQKLHITQSEREIAYAKFEKDILMTEKLIGRNLSAWKL